MYRPSGGAGLTQFMRKTSPSQLCRVRSSSATLRFLGQWTSSVSASSTHCVRCRNGGGRLFRSYCGFGKPARMVKLQLGTCAPQGKGPCVRITLGAPHPYTRYCTPA